MKLKVVLIMGLLGILFSCSNDYSPYKNKSTNNIYNLLFAEYKHFKEYAEPTKDYPWNILLSVKPDKDKLFLVIKDNNIESRLKALAYNRLLENGSTVNNKDIHGVIIEYGLKDGLDTLAVYHDGTARYINHSGKMIIWEQNDDALLKTKIDLLFKQSEILVKQIGPWDKDRLPPPKKDRLRISFLVSDGLYFGEGNINVMLKDQLASPIFSTCTEIMIILTEKAIKNGN